jgi:hypothetical protein
MRYVALLKVMVSTYKMSLKKHEGSRSLWRSNAIVKILLQFMYNNRPDLSGCRLLSAGSGYLVVGSYEPSYSIKCKEFRTQQINCFIRITVLHGVCWCWKYTVKLLGWFNFHLYQFNYNSHRTLTSTNLV